MQENHLIKSKKPHICGDLAHVQGTQSEGGRCTSQANGKQNTVSAGRRET